MRPEGINNIQAQIRFVQQISKEQHEKISKDDMNLCIQVGDSLPSFGLEQSQAGVPNEYDLKAFLAIHRVAKELMNQFEYFARSMYDDFINNAFDFAQWNKSSECKDKEQMDALAGAFDRISAELNLNTRDRYILELCLRFELLCRAQEIAIKKSQSGEVDNAKLKELINENFAVPFSFDNLFGITLLSSDETVSCLEDLDSSMKSELAAVIKDKLTEEIVSLSTLIQIVANLENMRGLESMNLVSRLP